MGEMFETVEISEEQEDDDQDVVTAQVWATSGGFQPGDQDG
jgi:hypothetical protein